MTECKTFYFCSEEWERLKKWRWRRMVDVNQGGSAAAAWWQHRKGSITELTDSMLQPRAGYTHTLDTGFILVESGLLRDCEKKCRCFVCSSKWEPECVRWTLAGCVMLVVARAGRSSILVLCGGQRAAAVMVDTSYNNYRLQGRGRNIQPLRLHQQTEARFLCLYLCLCAPLPWWMNLQADGMVQKWVSFFRRQGSCFRDQCGF